MNVDIALRKKIGRSIQRARQEHGYKNVSMLADELAIPEGTIVRWEQGKSTPSVDVALAIAQHLDITIDELVGKSTKADADPIEEDLLESFRRCTPDRRQRILETARDAALMSIAVEARGRAGTFANAASPSSKVASDVASA